MLKYSKSFLLSILIFLGCNSPLRTKVSESENILDPKWSELYLRAVQAFETLSSQSDSIYDGDGTWGQNRFQYRMALRDSYWRLDVYRKLYQTSVLDAEKNQYLSKIDEIVSYLLGAQEEAGTGVFGVPADTHNPEFGSQISQALALCAACANRGWMISFPPQMGSDNLYYDHGYALYTLSRIYEIRPSAPLLEAIIRAGEWAKIQPPTWNINYLSALSKGLSEAYVATGHRDFLDRALELHTIHIIPHQQSDGQWDDSHNQQLEYHGFIVSGLIILKRALVFAGSENSTVDLALSKALHPLQSRDSSETATIESTWPGTNLLAWMELSELRSLTADEKIALYRTVDLMTKFTDNLNSETGFRLQKGLYMNYFLGLYIADPQ